ncbi:hypothetical protein [Sphingomonas sp. Mn802worker]|uniref:hypothetical protein n=1 Tax=Sphingomonas sp. Mn802worker TaxID=629773 RepID=UPI000364A69E|nr:hypothetical protein [Sphingomonas sp. Mn802worker]
MQDAFWQGQLGFCPVHFAREQHELMLRVMSAIEGRRVIDSEDRHDLFDGDMVFWRFYQCWLASIGMLEMRRLDPNMQTPLSAMLSPEGISVLMMLRATRDPAWEDLPMADVIDAVKAADAGENGAREQALRSFERSVGLRRHVFARERIARSHALTLTGLTVGSGARMPTRRVTWSMSFTDGSTRDHLFAWLAVRIARWDDWGELAFSMGADALTRHLMGMIVASQAEGTFR